MVKESGWGECTNKRRIPFGVIIFWINLRLWHFKSHSNPLLPAIVLKPPFKIDRCGFLISKIHQVVRNVFINRFHCRIFTGTISKISSIFHTQRAEWSFVKAIAPWILLLIIPSINHIYFFLIHPHNHFKCKHHSPSQYLWKWNPNTVENL